MKSHDNAFDAVFGEGSPGSKLLNEKNSLMNRIVDHIKENNITQREASIKIGCQQPRVSRLMAGKISEFSLGWLFNAANNLGA